MQMQTQINNPKDAANVQQLLPATVARFAGKYLRHRSFRSFIHFGLLSFSHVSGSLFAFDQKGCLDIILIAITHTHTLGQHCVYLILNCSERNTSVKMGPEIKSLIEFHANCIHEFVFN